MPFVSISTEPSSQPDVSNVVPQIRLYTQHGKDERGLQFAYCIAHESRGDDDGPELGSTMRVFVMEAGSLEQACRHARRLGLRMIERFTLHLKSTVTVEFVNVMDEEG
ncbi:MAG: hypothetical protein DI537_10520 [Stutzerimonas stutzeri]|nr:MAG: hypothetical protein DI537_10520 [Stutzerimonas stutzeri]